MSNGKEPVEKLASDVVAKDAAKQAGRPGKAQAGAVSALPRWWPAAAALLAILLIALVFLAVRAAVSPGGVSKPTGSPTAATQPLRYELVNSGPSSITLDPATCNQNLDFIWKIDGNSARLEGQTATATATGPGLQPTYTSTVKGGQMEFKATAPGSAWSSGPSTGCAVAGGGSVTFGMTLTTVGNLRAYPDATLK